MHYLNTDLIKLYPLRTWIELINEFKKFSCFRCLVKGEDYTIYLIKDPSVDSPPSQDLITIKIKKDNASIEILYKEDTLIKDFYDLLIEAPLEKVCLFWNNEKPLIARLVQWRLENYV